MDPEELLSIDFYYSDLRYGDKHGYKVTPIAPRVRPTYRKGIQKKGEGKKFVKSIIREVTGFAPYERRIMELLRNNKDKKAKKLTKKRVSLCSCRRHLNYRLNALNSSWAPSTVPRESWTSSALSSPKADVHTKPHLTPTPSHSSRVATFYRPLVFLHLDQPMHVLPTAMPMPLCTQSPTGAIYAIRCHGHLFGMRSLSTHMTIVYSTTPFRTTHNQHHGRLAEQYADGRVTPGSPLLQRPEFRCEGANRAKAAAEPVRKPN